MASLQQCGGSGSMDLALFGWIWIWIQILQAKDPFIWQFWVIYFLKFENPSNRSKFMIVIFSNLLNFLMLPLFLKMDAANFFHFLTKSTLFWGLITFEPLDGFSNLIKAKHSEFQALCRNRSGYRSGSRSAKRSWIGIQICILKSKSNTLIRTKTWLVI